MAERRVRILVDMRVDESLEPNFWQWVRDELEFIEVEADEIPTLEDVPPGVSSLSYILSEFIAQLIVAGSSEAEELIEATNWITRPQGDEPT